MVMTLESIQLQFALECTRGFLLNQFLMEIHENFRIEVNARSDQVVSRSVKDVLSIETYSLHFLLFLKNLTKT